MVKAPARSYDPQEVERSLLEHWKERKVFEQSVDNRRDANRPFIFLEGPPTANGLPGVHHVLARCFKDLICRYKTMKGHLVERKGGWDTHGLPVELEVERRLGLKSKKEIEEYGMAKFNAQCKESVFKYEKEWKAMTERMAFWVDMEDPYITLRNDYIESVWWSLRAAWDKGLIYKGFKVAPWCPRCGTALSSHEVAQGYKDVEDPSIFVKFKAVGEDYHFLAWTTTPWTLLANVALAVHPDHWYACIESEGQKLVMAEELVPQIVKGEHKVIWRLQGSDMEGKSYEPAFDFVRPDKKAWFIVLADFVTLDEGTGIVHTAPAFGEDDANVGKEYDLPHVQPVDLEGKFTDAVSPLAGMFVKDADPRIIEMLDEKGILAGRRNYSHSYPFCWRCDTPLLYYARDSWFIAMSKLRHELMANNAEIDWHPENLKDGRFGDFLKNVKDWALSRERYWGTPLPVWTCGCGAVECLGSAKEIEERSGGKLEDYHKPFIDDLKVKCKKCGNTMEREPYVIDVWYDSGSSFFAQWHYPFENTDIFDRSFPIDFISEAIDQTRGWFYTLLAISTFTHDSLCFRNCLCLGHVLDKNGQKMSKSRPETFVEPWSILDEQGTDAIRWYYCLTNAPWAPKRFDIEQLNACYAKFMLTLWNSYSFYAGYASLDGFDLDKHIVTPGNRPPLDRWLLSRLHRTIAAVDDHYDNYNIHKAARALEAFVVNDLSNWYIRRSRKRYWQEGLDEDKRAGYSTLHEALLATARMAAPMIPFITDEIYMGLTEGSRGDSIHITDFPEPDRDLLTKTLEAAMAKVIDLAESGRSMRAKAQIKNRQPLASASLVPKRGEGEDEGDVRERCGVLEPLLPILGDELNVKKIGFSDGLGDFEARHPRPNHKSLGPKHKAKAAIIAKAIEAMDPIEALTAYDAGDLKVTVDGDDLRLDREDLVIETRPAEGFAIGTVEDMYLVLDIRVDDELKAEGIAREVIRRVQQMRKEMDLALEDRIDVLIAAPNELSEMMDRWKGHIMAEVRADNMGAVGAGTDLGPPKGDGSLVTPWDVDGERMTISVKRA